MFIYMNFDIPGVVKKLHLKGKHQDGNWCNNNATRTQYMYTYEYKTGKARTLAFLIIKLIKPINENHPQT